MRVFNPINILCILVFIGILNGKVSSAASYDEDIYPFLFSDDFEEGAAREWKPNFPASWEVRDEDSSSVYKLVTPGEPGRIRAPFSWSVLEDFDVSGFVFQGKIRCDAEESNPHRDVVILFNFQDSEHFYYVHFSAVSDELHNIIALVDGKDRVKINLEAPGGSTARLTDNSFHDFKVTYNLTTGEILAYLDDMNTPILTAVDKTLHHGAVGIGSFDDTASFDDIRLWGNIYEK